LKAPPHGRGARTNRSGRYESESAEAFHDGWSDLDEPAPPLRTELTAEKARSILSWNDSPDVGFDRSINTYRGCEHGCIYCYARPAHAYVGLSPGVDFESKLFFKPDAAKLLEKELSKPGYRCGPVHIGGNTDVYQPSERQLRITRGVIEVLAKFRHPFSVITKSALIARDIDLIAPMAAQGLAKAYISITTLDRKLARDMEPRASTPEKRLEAVSALAKAGVPTGVGFAPVIAGLNDHEMEAVLERAYAAGARSAMMVALRLPREIHGLFEEWLAAARPDRAAKVMSLVRQMRNGRVNDARFGARMVGSGPVADMLHRRFTLACNRIGLNLDHRPLRTDLFQPPIRPQSPTAQMDLFS